MLLQQEQFGLSESLGQFWSWTSSEGEVVVDPSALYGWLEATAVGRLHARLEGRLHTGTEED